MPTLYCQGDVYKRNTDKAVEKTREKKKEKSFIYFTGRSSSFSFLLPI
jgi:hypothetical protein